MPNEQQDLNPDKVKEESGETPELDYVQRRANELKGLKDKPDETETEEPEEEVDEEGVEKDESEETEEEETAEDEEKSEDDEIVLSNVDYEALSEDSSEELGRVLKEKLGDKVYAFAKGLGSGFGKDAAKLKGKIRDLTEENEKLKSGMEKVLPQTSEFSDINTLEDLDKTEDHISKLYEYYDDVAIAGKWEMNDEGDEGIYDQGKFYPKEQMQEFLKGWRRQLKAIPQRRQQLKARTQADKKTKEVIKTLESKLDWFADEDSEKFKEYQETLNSPALVSAFQILPELKTTLTEAIAYAIEGKSKRSKINIPLTSQKKPHGGQDSGAGGGSRGKPKGLAEAERRIKTGQHSEADWIAVRAQQYKKLFNK